MRPDRDTLVVGPSWVGDTLMAAPLIAGLAARGQRVSLLTPPHIAPLLVYLPGVAEVLESPFRHGRVEFSARRRLARELRGFRRAWVLPNSWKSALVPALAGIPERIGYRGELRYGLLTRALPPARQLPRLVDRYCALAGLETPAPDPRLRLPEAFVEQTLTRLGLDHELPAVALCVGAEYGPAKRWPVRHFAELARRFRARGWQVWLPGASADRPQAEAVAAAAPEARVLVGETRLDEAAALLAAARLVVSNDSGLMHLAAALDRPLLALYGSSSPAYTPPLSAGARVLSLGLSCSPCFRRDCRLGTTACLEQLGPDVAWEAAWVMASADETSRVLP